MYVFHFLSSCNLTRGVYNQEELQTLCALKKLIKTDCPNDIVRLTNYIIDTVLMLNVTQCNFNEFPTFCAIIIKIVLQSNIVRHSAHISSFKMN